jgi:predicted secreted hydrolase
MTSEPRRRRFACRAARIARGLLPLASLLAASGDGGDWTAARPDYAWSFPRDHWAHPAFRNEWWYFTGQLTDVADSSRHFGYQFTLFRIGVLRRAPSLASDWSAQMLVMGHAAVTDIGAGTHRFSEVVYRAIPLLGGFGEPGDSLLAWSRGPAGTDERWTLRWNDGFQFRMADRRQDLAFDLRTTAEKPLVLQGPNGFSAKNAGGTIASQYYSFTRLATEGTLRAGGRTFAVRGATWMDKEFGSNQRARGEAGWDWFSLQLDDGREVMLYLMRDTSGQTSWSSGTLVPRHGAPRSLDGAAFSVRATDHWTSDTTKATYPSRWTIVLPGEQLALDVVPLVADQENRSALLRRLFYWEGAVAVRADGRTVGRGYVELVGYGKGLRPAL